MHDISTQSLDSEGNELLDLNEADRHALLASDRRRHLIRVLSESSAPVGLSDLSVAVQRVASRSPGSVDRSADEISVELHHNHLPRLDAHALVDYVPETHQVEVIRL